MSQRTLLRPSQTGFDPRSISGLALWLDAADSGTLFQDAAATVPATATNDPVGAWLDKSGNGRHATQATAASRPTVAALGARTAIGFAGSNSVTTPSYSAKATSTYVYVARHDDAADTLFQTGAINQFHSHIVEGNVHKFRRYEVLNSGIVLGSNVGVGVASLWSVAYSNSDLAVRYSGTPIGSTSSASTTPISDSTQATTLGRLAPGEAFLSLNGRIAEFLVYGRALSAAERQRIERYLAAKWGITLAPQVSNADAQDWINRVYANGGTVSASTANAVNQFCVDIENAGIRDRFYRLNLFCGNSDASLNAVRTPLFRGPSLTGTQFGNTTDTNLNFGPGDYAETGASGGLTGNGTTKYLNTGFPTNTLSAGDRHLAFYANTWPNEIYREFIGSESAAGAGAQQFALGHQIEATRVHFRFASTSGRVPSAVISGGAFWVGTSGTTTTGRIFRNGILSGDGTLTAATPTSSQIFVFAINRASTPAPESLFPGRGSGYSIGAHMTDAQALAYNNAMQTFQTALGRQV